MAFDFFLSLLKFLPLLSILSTSLALPSSPGFVPSNDGLSSTVRQATRGNNASAWGGITATSSPVSGYRGISILCDGSQYRTGLEPLSCQDAVHQIPRDSKHLRVVAPEQRGREHNDVTLPIRFISYDGLCTIDIVTKDGVTSDTTSYYDLSRASISLEHACVAKNQVGGIAMNIGEQAGLGLVMTSFQPRVQCRRGQAPPLGNCRHLADTMKTTQEKNTWGNPRDPNAFIKLPKPLYEGLISLNAPIFNFAIILPIASEIPILTPKSHNLGNRQCAAVIRTVGPTDISSFYEIWENIVAVNGMCVRFGHLGSAVAIGVS
ncbi:MAG: hypothetical protein Q9197_001882 [Variospora fuerteventurae]